MARWLSPSLTPQAEWLWVQSTATGAIVPLIEASAGMAPPFLNNGAADPPVSTIQAGMFEPSIQVNTGLDAAPVFTAAGLMPAPNPEVTETSPRNVTTARMIVPVVSKTVVCFPKVLALKLVGKVPAIPVGAARFPSAASFTIAGKVPTVSSVTPTTVTPSAVSFTITGKVPALPTGPRIPYIIPITVQ